MDQEELREAYAWAKQEQEHYFPDADHVRLTDLDSFQSKYYAHVSFFTDGKGAIMRVYWPAFTHQRGVSVARVKYSILDNFDQLYADHTELTKQMLRNGLWAWQAELTGMVQMREPVKRPEGLGKNGKVVAFPRALEGRPVEETIALEWLTEKFSVCKVRDLSELDPMELGGTGKMIFTAATDREYSLVCPTRFAPGGTIAREDGWCAFRVCGQLDFSLIGILSKISSALAAARVGLFAVSTYDTDYILIKEKDKETAQKALQEAGCRFVAGERVGT